MPNITYIYAREILDSRGLPTIECSVWLDTGHMVISSVPTGLEKGKFSAVSLVDNDPDEMTGQGVAEAINNINNIIAPQLVGKNPTKQTEADQLLINLDGTRDKSRLGANALLAVSQAILKAGAICMEMPLYYYIQQKYQLTTNLEIPTCIYSMFNGGIYGTNNLDLKDFSIIPASHIQYRKSLNMAVTFFQKLEGVLISKEAIHCVGKVGGFAPNLFSNTDAFEILIETTKTTPYTFAQDLFLGIDVSASHLLEDGKYFLRDRSTPYTAKELLAYYRTLRTAYQVTHIEDPFKGDDWKSWQELTKELGETTNIIGNKLLTANKDRLQKAIQDQLCNTVAIKPIQAGTISETIDFIKTAKESNFKIIISQRSGETNDDLLADLAVGVGAHFVKFGAPNRGERVAKYNRLLEIYQQLAKWRNPQ
ncbi:phosphopyruvate hydratase [Patescibacteria group bacterium]|nr:phosphopyruvate hydratase [Patescibacteria group bacterium]MBU1967173.1 phosphopyruvate hydratase [Patescibacteria group bacterium]MBU2543317.1 phosphopyruvate hydratase [Patescibacteria group bacterium]